MTDRRSKTGFATLRQFLRMIEDHHEKWSEAFIKDMGGGRIRPLLELGPIKDEIELSEPRVTFPGYVTCGRRGQRPQWRAPETDRNAPIVSVGEACALHA